MLDQINQLGRDLRTFFLSGEPIRHRPGSPLDIPAIPKKPIRFSDMENVSTVGAINDLELHAGGIDDQALVISDTDEILRLSTVRDNEDDPLMVTAMMGGHYVDLDWNARQAMREWLRLVDE